MHRNLRVQRKWTASLGGLYFDDGKFAAIVKRLKLTLSPLFRVSRNVASLTENTMVIGGISRFLIAPCFKVIFLASLSIFRTSASVKTA